MNIKAKKQIEKNVLQISQAFFMHHTNLRPTKPVRQRLMWRYEFSHILIAFTAARQHSVDVWLVLRRWVAQLLQQEF
jgi:hypothetical protein